MPITKWYVIKHKSAYDLNSVDDDAADKYLPLRPSGKKDFGNGSEYVTPMPYGYHTHIPKVVKRKLTLLEKAELL